MAAFRAASARVDRPLGVGVPAAPTSTRLSAPSGWGGGLSGAGSDDGGYQIGFVVVVRRIVIVVEIIL